ncbi:MAG TPA: YjbE family putative metal transport protein [Candidatus Limnocylindrales bacterium]|nr:YjbE family putative metal transport protein [Candidatus Limnocylindrales bacterium]
MDIDPLVRLLSITLINVALSGDNVVVIGMAAASLPAHQRRLAILCGGLLAIVLRIGLTAVAELLLAVPLLPVVGGAALVFISWRLLDANGPGEGVASSGADGLGRAIMLIVAADLTMSVENVIAVAGAAGDDVGLAVFGLLTSMPLLLVAGGVVASIIDRARWLIYLGAAVICFAGLRMILDDEHVVALTELSATARLLGGLAAAAVLTIVFAWLRGRTPADHQPQERTSHA